MKKDEERNQKDYEEVKEVLRILGGEAKLQDITDLIEKRNIMPSIEKVKDLKSAVSRELQKHCSGCTYYQKGAEDSFLKLGGGMWCLKDYDPSLRQPTAYEAEETDISSYTGDPGENKIYYGTPGCGKSYHVSHNVVSEDKGFRPEHVFRTTFHQDYSNVDFVGQVMPVITKSEAGTEVSYRFIPGPFTLALECAADNPSEKVALVIEELNRGNAASIFGDIFQLLDRVDTADKAESAGIPLGTSEYPIVNVGISNYFITRENNPIELNEIRIPANLFIYATMNTSDQNVFTLDTAFKRRWNSEKLSNTFLKGEKIGSFFIPYSGKPSGITWETFVKAINNYMISRGSFNSEDKQIGKYFVSENMLCKSETDMADEKKAKAFAYKVLEYIWSDVAKFNRSDWFRKDIRSFDDLVAEYASKGISVFNTGVGFKAEEKADASEADEAGEESNEG